MRAPPLPGPWVSWLQKGTPHLCCLPRMEEAMWGGLWCTGAAQECRLRALDVSIRPLEKAHQTGNAKGLGRRLSGCNRLSEGEPAGAESKQADVGEAAPGGGLWEDGVSEGERGVRSLPWLGGEGAAGGQRGGRGQWRPARGCKEMGDGRRQPRRSSRGCCARSSQPSWTEPHRGQTEERKSQAQS